MYLINDSNGDICGFCKNFYQDKRQEEFLLFGVCGNSESGRMMAKYGEPACKKFTDGIKSIIEQCFREGVVL